MRRIIDIIIVSVIIICVIIGIIDDDKYSCQYNDLF